MDKPSPPRAALSVLRPPPRLALSEWIEANVELPRGLAATPGPMRLWAHQRAIADSIGDPEVERVTVQKSARVGYSSLLSAVIGYHIASDPGPILAVLPVESDCRGWLVDDIEPTFNASPVLRDKLRPPSRTPDERSTLLHRFFPGGSLKIVAARAPRNLRRHSARILLLDELDAFETSAEGDPVSLAERRTLTFPNRKIVAGSTPLDEGTSAIAKLFEESDQRVFEIACPRCRTSFEIQWMHICWPENDPGRAHCVCPRCEAAIEERAKAGLVEAGKWHVTRPEVEGHHGYKLNALISPLEKASWPHLAAEFLAAAQDRNRLKVFTNTLLGEPWREGDDEVDENDLVGRCEEIDLEHIPAEVLVLTAGVDVQDDRLEISTLGFDRAGVVYVLEHSVIYGRPRDANDASWSDLDDHLKRRHRHPKGGVIGVDAAVIDAGDGESFDAVLGFARSRGGRRILAGKGAAGFSRPPLAMSKSKRGTLYIVGVDPLKSRVLGLLASPAKLIHFSKALAATDYFSQLTAERRVTRLSRGQPQIRFERRQGTRSEALDCAVYALAAKAAVASIDLDRREAELGQVVPVERKRPTVYRSSWADYGRF